MKKALVIGSGLVLSVLAVPVSSGEDSQLFDREHTAASALLIRDEIAVAGSSTDRTISGKKSVEWVGPCSVHNLPYQGLFGDGTSAVWWAGTFDQPSPTTCLSDQGTWTDIWEIPATPGDVFDIVFGGAYNTFVGVSDAYAPTYTLQQYATVASTSVPR